jgi:hypothetical protein
LIPLFNDRLGISSSGNSLGGTSPSQDQAFSLRASFKVPIFVPFSPVLWSTSSQATISTILGRPKTRAIPPSLKSSAVDSETQGRSSLSASAGPSCARPTNALREELPHTLITDTTEVKTPSGERAKMTLSRVLMDSERNCFVSRSPNNVIKGAFDRNISTSTPCLVQTRSI